MKKRRQGDVMKRRRRKTSEISKLRNKLLEAVKKEGRITLTDLVGLYGLDIDIRDTISDRNLAKRQLDILAHANEIQFSREGRDLVATAPTPKPEPAPVPIPATPPPTPSEPAATPPTTEPAAKPEPAPAPSPAPAPQPLEAASEPSKPAPELREHPELEAIKAYGKQLEAFSKTLLQQINTLVKMLETAKK